jgi:hypothetical protein
MSLISLEISRQNQVTEKPRYQNVLGNRLERSQRPPIKGEKGSRQRQTTITSRQTITDTPSTSDADAHQAANVLSENDTSSSHITYPYKNV